VTAPSRQRERAPAAWSSDRHCEAGGAYHRKTDEPVLEEAQAVARNTLVAIDGEDWLVNGRPRYERQYAQDTSIED